MSGALNQTARVIPKAKRPTPQGAFEIAMSLGTALPGTLGFICRRKLKRRYCNRAQDTFSEVLRDTHAGDLCIDLGANVGEITSRMATTGADVISFEPDPAAFEALSRAVAGMDNVTLYAKAAGVRAETLMLRRSANWSPDDPTSHTAMSSLVRTDAKMADDNSVAVEVVDIIGFLETLNRDIRILKMDIEGAEWEILQKLIDHPLLARIDCIFVETHERVDPARYVPVFDMLQARAEALTRPYINLYWI